MSTYSTISVTRDERNVVRLDLNRPDKRNAMSGEMIAEITDFCRRLADTPDVRSVILSGAGNVFCAGGDLEWMKAQIAADRETRMREARTLARMLHALNTLPVPLIGRVQGGAFGGGVGLLCVCDVVVSDDGAKFGLTETRLGLIPATIGPYVIARLGEGMARRFFMSGRVFGAQEATAIGLTTRVVPPSELDAAVESEVIPYLSAAPGAVAAAKALARTLGPPIDDSVIDDTIRRLADIWEAREAMLGIEAFLTRRPAPWAIGTT
ncbi:crotonase/enoyl-CoA hydratase family protein [Mesorhizobium sp. M0751]|uniref:crotonase/enoyl-CoA hydratase family protein n=1 Tax=unclassified Mesorhizobium TaxID=325217 RepID=UPI003335FFD2